jgi:hypothetical protein
MEVSDTEREAGRNIDTISTCCLKPIQRAFHETTLKQGERVFRLRSVTIIGFYCLLCTYLLHVSVIQPSLGRNIFTRNHSIDN